MANAAEELSADEIALYDRQLRLWGIEAQNRMRKAKVLLVTIRALGNEVAKNLVLAGIGSLTIVDPGRVTEEDVSSQFFVTAEGIGKNRAEASVEEIRRLNPRVHVHADPTSITSKEAVFFQDFDVVIATELTLSVMISLNERTRSRGIPFYAASLQGLGGIIFVDLIEHTFLVTPPPARDGSKPVPPTQRKETYASLSRSLSTPYGKSLKPRQARKILPLLPLSHALLRWLDTVGSYPTTNDFSKFSQIVNTATSNLSLSPTLCTPSVIQNFLTQLEPSEVSGVAAIVGGILSQDVLNALGGRELPIKNWLIFDGNSCEGKIYGLMGDSGEKA